MVLLIRGASESARVNAIMVLIKLGVLILFAVIGFTAFDADHFSNFFGKGLAGVSAAAGTIFFSFIGLDAVATAGEEVKNPKGPAPSHHRRSRHRVGIYLAAAAAGLAAKPVSFFEDSDNAEAGLALILKEITGNEFWSTILSAGAVISIFSVTLVTLYGQTRILFAIGRDGLIPRKFLEVSPKTMTPTFNTIVVAIVVALIGGSVPRTICGTPSRSGRWSPSRWSPSASSSCDGPIRTLSDPSGSPATRSRRSSRFWPASTFSGAWPRSPG